MMRGHAQDAQVACGMIERVLPKQQAMLARAARVGDDTVRGAYADARAARSLLNTADRTRSRALHDYPPALDRLGRVGARVPDHLLDRRGDFVRDGNGITGAFARRGCVEAAERHRQRLGFLGAIGRTHWEPLDAAGGRAGVSPLLFEERARVTRVERNLRVRLLEVQRLRQSLRPAGCAFLVRGAPVLDGWQRTELRGFERELLAARDDVLTSSTSATTVAGLGRLTHERLSEIRSVLKADADARRMLSVLGVVPRNGTLSADLRIGMAQQATRGLHGSFAGFRTMDAYEMARNARLYGVRARGWSAADVAPMHQSWERQLQTAGRLAAHGASGFLRDLPSPYPKGAVGRGLAGAHARWLSGETSGGSTLLDSLGFVIEDEEAEELHGEPLTAEEESRIAAVIAMVMWSQTARVERRSEGRKHSPRKQIFIAQPGAFLREICGAVAAGTAVVSHWAWECPLWAVRAHLTLSERLTPDERLSLSQKRRVVPAVIAGATFACLSMPPEAAVLSCWMAELNILTYYEELARLCSVHGLDGLVPDEWRHDR